MVETENRKSDEEYIKTAPKLQVRLPKFEIPYCSLDEWREEVGHVCVPESPDSSRREEEWWPAAHH